MKNDSRRTVDVFAFRMALETGLSQGGVDWDNRRTRVSSSERARAVWWIDAMPKGSALCGLKVTRNPGGVAITTLGEMVLLQKAGGKYFRGNALDALGFGKVVLTFEEATNPEVVTQLGKSIALLVRGTVERPVAIEWDEERSRQYPMYAWSAAARASDNAKA